MRFEQLPIAGAVLVSIDASRDARGFFARTFCAREFENHGLPSSVAQLSISYNERRGTVRGLHFQWPPTEEDKLVRCVRGQLFDILVDLRPSSPTFLKHCGIPLDAENRDSVFVPHGVAHGFQTLVDHTEVLYQMTSFYAPELDAGVRWNDPQFGIQLPLPASIISPRDADYPDFDRVRHAAEMDRHSGGVAKA